VVQQTRALRLSLVLPVEVDRHWVALVGAAVTGRAEIATVLEGVLVEAEGNENEIGTEEALSPHLPYRVAIALPPIRPLIPIRHVRLGSIQSTQTLRLQLQQVL
jgi:hypothetical protein